MQRILALILTVALFITLTSARAIVPRGTNGADQQLTQAVTALSNDKTKIAEASTGLDKVDANLKQMLSGRETPKIRILFSLFHGTLGDVGKAESYFDELSKMGEFEMMLVTDVRTRQYLAESFQKKYSVGIARTANTEKDPEQGFYDAFVKAIDDFQPDTIMRANPVERAYKDVPGLYNKFRERIDERLDAGKSNLIDVKAFWLDPKNIEEDSKNWNEYHFNEREATVVGQLPLWYNNPDPAKTHQILVGDIDTYRDSDKPLDSKLQKFIDDAKGSNKKLMYLGLGAKLRPEEASMEHGTQALKEFYKAQASLHPDWKFIMFHNTRDVKDATDPPITDDGNVFHVWFPQDQQPKIFEQMDLVLHHGGAGSFSAAVKAGAPQLIMPLGNWSPDQKEWAAQAVKNEIGVSVEPITIGEEYDVEELNKVFKEVQGKLDAMKENVKPIQAQYEEATAPKVTAEIVKRWTQGRLENGGCGSKRKRGIQVETVWPLRAGFSRVKPRQTVSRQHNPRTEPAPIPHNPEPISHDPEPVSVPEPEEPPGVKEPEVGPVDKPSEETPKGPDISELGKDPKASDPNRKTSNVKNVSSKDDVCM